MTDEEVISKWSRANDIERTETAYGIVSSGYTLDINICTLMMAI